MWTLQGFLFAAFGALWSKSNGSSSLGTPTYFIFIIISFVGIVSSGSIWFSLIVSAKCQGELVMIADIIFNDHSNKGKILKEEDKILFEGKFTKYGDMLFPWNALPLCFIVAWLSLFYVVMHKQINFLSKSLLNKFDSNIVLKDLIMLIIFL